MAQVAARAEGKLADDRNAADNWRVFLEVLKDNAALDALYPKLIAAYPDDYVYPFRYGRNLLERGDRMTMAASIESRVPFLDHELAGFVSSLPDSYRVKGMKTKWILRQAGRSLIPEKILNRPKVGFRVPVNKWFQGPMKDYLRDHLQGAESKTRGYYDPQVLDRVVGDHIEGRQNHEKLLWALLNLEIWHRQYA